MADRDPGAPFLSPQQLAASKILGLTIHNPWAWAVAKRLKPIENRTWAPPKGVVGKLIAIHSGRKGADDPDELFAFRRAVHHPLIQPKLTALIGEDTELTLDMMPLGSVLAVGRLARVVTHYDDLKSEERVWWVGPFAWVFEDVVDFPPVPCRGSQKLWALPPDVLDIVRPRYVAAKAARKAA